MRRIPWNFVALALVVIFGALYVQSRVSRAKAEATAAAETKQAKQAAGEWQAKYEAQAKETQSAIEETQSALSKYAGARANVRYVRTVDTVGVVDSMAVVSPGFIVAADSVAETCRLLSATCDALRVSADSMHGADRFVIKGLEAQIKAAKRRGFLEKAGLIVVGAAAGYLVGQLTP